MHGFRATLRSMASAIASISVWVAVTSSAQAVENFPVIRPASRAQAVLALSGGAPMPVPCLSPLVQSLLDDPASGSPAARRAMSLLQSNSHLHAERRLVEPDGTAIRFTLLKSSFDRIDPRDEDDDGRPDLVEAVLGGVAEARRLFGTRLGLPVPDSVEVLLADLGADLEGYTVPAGGSDGRPLLVVDASPAGTPATARAAVIHQFAHATAIASGAHMPPEWGEALATWAAVRIDGVSDAKIATLLAARLPSLEQGLESDSLELAAGNALWLAFLDEAYGPGTLRDAVDALSGGLPATTAFDVALRRATGTSLTSAFREFQLWALLVGDRSNGQHFSFADRLAAPRFASEHDGLPALSVQTDPPVAALGAAAVLLRPAESHGGVSVRFEGEAPGRWEADVLLVAVGGALRRIPLELDGDGRGRVDLPLAGLSEAILLVRNLETESDTARRYAWSAQALHGFPFELASLDALHAGRNETLIVWETAAEHGLIGFNVLRFDEDGAQPVRVNAVWIPALGDEQTAASYQFLDATALPGVPYTYRIEGITDTGLSSASDPVTPRERPFRYGPSGPFGPSGPS